MILSFLPLQCRKVTQLQWQVGKNTTAALHNSEGVTQEHPLAYTIILISYIIHLNRKQ